MKIRMLAVAMLAAPALAFAQAEPKDGAKAAAKPAAKPAAKVGAVATVNGVAVPRSRMEFMMQQQAARGAADNDQTRAMVRDELVNREVVAQEAQRAGMAKTPEVLSQLDLARQEILVSAYIRDWVRKHPITDDDVRQVKFPALAEVRPRIQQQLVQGKVEELVRGLRAKAKVE